VDGLHGHEDEPVNLADRLGKPEDLGEGGEVVGRLLLEGFEGDRVVGDPVVADRVAGLGHAAATGHVR